MMIASVLRLAALALPLLLVPACHRHKAPLDEGQDPLTSEGLKLEDWKPIAPAAFSANECRGGRIEGLDVVLCAYGSIEARSRGAKGIEGWIATAVTGTYAMRDLEEGSTRFLLLGVADRARADLSGRTISKIVKAFSSK